jgi:hypothetical protein
MNDDPPAGSTGRGDELMRRYDIQPGRRMTDCVTCHR